MPMDLQQEGLISVENELLEVMEEETSPASQLDPSSTPKAYPSLWTDQAPDELLGHGKDQKYLAIRLGSNVP